MSKIIGIRLPNGDIVELKKDWFGYRVVERPKNVWGYIFGSKRNLFMLIFLLLIALGLYIGIQELIGAYKQIALHPCMYCINGRDVNPLLNLTNLNITK